MPADAVAALVGAMLLAVSIGADLAAHQAAEAANPCHRVIVTGQALLIGGLAVRYLSERARRTAGPPGG